MSETSNAASAKKRTQKQWDAWRNEHAERLKRAGADEDDMLWIAHVLKAFEFHLKDGMGMDGYAQQNNLDPSELYFWWNLVLSDEKLWPEYFAERRKNKL